MKFRHFAFFLILLLLGFLVLRNIGQIQQFIDLFKQLNIFILLLILPVRYGYYWASTRYFEHFYALSNKRIPHWELFAGVVSMNFVNTVIPTAGLSGAAYFAQIFKDKVTHKQSYLAQFFWYIATFLSLVLILGISFIILFFSRSIAQISFRLLLIVISFVLFVAFAVIAMTLNPKLFEDFLFIVTRPINWFLKLIRKGAITQRQTKQFVDGYRSLIELFAAHPKQAVRPFADALLCIVFEVLSIFVVYLAFGVFVNPGVAGTAYVFALLMSGLSFFTSGVGLYEATMVGVSVALGVPFAAAFGATAVYRLVALWLFIPIGLYFYKRQTVDKPATKEA